MRLSTHASRNRDILKYPLHVLMYLLRCHIKETHGFYQHDCLE